MRTDAVRKVTSSAEPDPSVAVLELLQARKKRDAERIARSFVLPASVFVDLILEARAGTLEPYRYACAFPRKTPAELELTPEDLDAIARNGVGPLSPAAQRAFRKADQTFQARQLGAAHLFYTRDSRYWHLFAFDQRDIQGEHWSGTSHLHYLADTFTREPLLTLWPRFQTGERPGNHLHLRFDPHA